MIRTEKKHWHFHPYQTREKTRNDLQEVTSPESWVIVKISSGNWWLLTEGLLATELNTPGLSGTHVEDINVQAELKLGW